MFANQIVGAPTTPAFCIAFFSSALLAKACAASSEAKSWVTVMSLGLSAAWYTAAVVGVILNLAVWFSLHLLFAETRPLHLLGIAVQVPLIASIDLPALALTLGAVLAVFRFKVGMMPVLAACSVLGVLFYAATGRF